MPVLSGRMVVRACAPPPERIHVVGDVKVQVHRRGGRGKSLDFVSTLSDSSARQPNTLSGCRHVWETHCCHERAVYSNYCP